MNTQLQHERLYFVDFCRMLALWYMIFQHGYISIANSSSIFFKKLNDFVPVCSAMFLFIAGFCSVLAHKSSQKLKIFRLLKRSFLLIGSSTVLFVLENGLQLPDMIFASNILNTIGVLTLTSILLFIIRPSKQLPVLTIFLTILTASFITLDIKRIYIFPLTNGYEPLLPTLIFGYIGLLIGVLFRECSNKNRLFVFLLIIGCVGMICLSIIFGFNHCFDNVARYRVIRIFKKNLLLYNIFGSDSGDFMQTIWNFNYISFLSSTSAVFIIFSISYFCRNLLTKLPNWIFAPGRTALMYYFVHLLVFAIIVLCFGYNHLTTLPFTIVILVLFLLNYPIALFYEKIKARCKSQSTVGN